jgi:hypothetical protein
MSSLSKKSPQTPPLHPACGIREAHSTVGMQDSQGECPVSRGRSVCHGATRVPWTACCPCVRLRPSSRLVRPSADHNRLTNVKDWPAARRVLRPLRANRSRQPRFRPDSEVMSKSGDSPDCASRHPGEKRSSTTKSRRRKGRQALCGDGLRKDRALARMRSNGRTDGVLLPCDESCTLRSAVAAGSGFNEIDRSRPLCLCDFVVNNPSSRERKSRTGFETQRRRGTEGTENCSPLRLRVLRASALFSSFEVKLPLRESVRSGSHPFRDDIDQRRTLAHSGRDVDRGHCAIDPRSGSFARCAPKQELVSK